MNSLFLALLIAQPNPWAAPETVWAPPFPAWTDAVKVQHQKSGQVAVVFVGVTPRKVAGVKSYALDNFPGATKRGVIVSRLYSDGLMHLHQVLPSTATDKEILVSAGLEVQPIAAVPFSSSQQPGAAEGRGRSAGSPQYNPSHRCPNCGTSQYAISGRGPVAGSHIHVCPRCGTAWYH